MTNQHTSADLAAAHTAALIEQGERIYRARIAAEGTRDPNCDGPQFCRCPTVSPCYPNRAAAGN